MGTPKENEQTGYEAGNCLFALPENRWMGGSTEHVDYESLRTAAQIGSGLVLITVLHEAGLLVETEDYMRELETVIDEKQRKYWFNFLLRGSRKTPDATHVNSLRMQSAQHTGEPVLMIINELRVQLRDVDSPDTEVNNAAAADYIARMIIMDEARSNVARQFINE